MDKSLIAYCGSYCGVCEWKDKINCKGCSANEGNMFWGECDKAKCCIGRGLNHCGECLDLPCDKLQDLFNDPEHGDQGVRLRNLRNWQAGNYEYEKLGNIGQEQTKELDMNRPVTTLFMLMSVDGKITSGASDALDFDKDLPGISGVKEGLGQYYDIEQTTDLWSLNSGRVQAKIGVNEEKIPKKTPVSFVVIDNHHLTEKGVRYFCALSKEFVLTTTNRDHPAFRVKESNLNIIYQDKLDLGDMLHQLKDKYGCERITIQTGGTLNGLFLRQKLFDYVDIVVAPLLVGGKNTSTLIDGEAVNTPEQLSSLGVLKLESVQALADSYIRMRYKVIS